MDQQEIGNEDLIAAVLQRPALWDKTSKAHKNRFTVDAAWKNLAVGFGLPGDSQVIDLLRKKWKALRDTYRNQLKKMPVSRSGDGAEDYDNYSTWAHFSSMSFLRDQMRPRKMTGNLRVEIEDQENDPEACYDEEFLNESAAGPFEVQNPPAEESLELGSPPKKIKKTSKPNNAAERLLDIETKKLQLLEKKAAPKERDEDEAFLESLLPHLRKLKAEEKLVCRAEMLNVVLKHAYPDLNN